MHQVAPPSPVAAPTEALTDLEQRAVETALSALDAAYHRAVPAPELRALATSTVLSHRLDIDRSLTPEAQKTFLAWCAEGALRMSFRRHARAAPLAQLRDAWSECVKQIAALPIGQQRVMSLRFEHNLSFDEISVALGWNLREVEIAYGAAICALRPALESSVAPEPKARA